MEQMQVDVKEFMTQEEAAAYLGKSHRTLEAWRSKIFGPAYFELGDFMLGRRRIGYLREDLDAWIASNKEAIRRVQP